MNSSLQYTVSLQDRVSAGMNAIQASTQGVTSAMMRMQGATSLASSVINGTGTSIASLRQKMETLRAQRDLLPPNALTQIRTANREVQSLERQLARLESVGTRGGGGNMLGSMLGNMGSMLTSPGLLIGAGIGNAIRLGVEKDMQKSSIETMLLGDTAKAATLLGDIGKYAKESPYNKAGLIDAQKTMMSFGLSSDIAFGKLKQIGDIALGDKNKMQGLSVAFAQVGSAGKLQGQDLLQMINQGFNPLNEISRTTGESYASLRKKMEQGAISADMVSRAFETATQKGGMFFGGAEKGGKTLGGKFSTLMDEIDETFLVLYDNIQPLLMPLIDMATKGFEFIGKAANAFSFGIKEIEAPVWAAIQVITALGAAYLVFANFSAIAAWGANTLTFSVLKANLAFLASPIVWVIAGIAALVAAVVYCAYKFNGWGEQWKLTMNIFKGAVGWMVDGVKLQMQYFINAHIGAFNAVGIAYYKFKKTLGIGTDEDNNKAIAGIESQGKARMEAIAKTQKSMDDNSKLMKSGMKWVVKADNSVSLTSTADDLKKKLGIGGAADGVSLTSTADDLKKKLGIGGAADGTGAGSTKGAGSAGSATNEATATGGSKSQTFNINIKNLIETINNMSSTGSFRENASEIEAQAIDALARALNLAVQMA